jgi:hypothetical protein
VSQPKDPQHALAAIVDVEETRTATPCTGTCTGEAAREVTLRCGCVDVHYVDGTVCYEHNHVECCGHSPEEHQPAVTSGGVVLTEDVINRLAAEAEAGYDLDQLHDRPPARRNLT